MNNPIGFEWAFLYFIQIHLINITHYDFYLKKKITLTKSFISTFLASLNTYTEY